MSRVRFALIGAVLVAAGLVAIPNEGSAAPVGDSFGLVDPATGIWHLYDGGQEVGYFYFGNPGDYPFMGDWNCDGIDTPGLYRQSDGYVYLRNSNTQGVADISFYFGNPGDVPIAGDFNANGCDTVSIYRPSNQTFYIINKLGTNDGGLGSADYSYVFGNPGDKPFIGDFNGNGQDTPGLHRESTGLVYYRNTNTQGIADNQFIYGDPGDRFVAGDWTNNGIDSPGVFRPSNTTMYLRYQNSQGNADASWMIGGAGWLPVAGVFGDNLPPPPTTTTTTTTTAPTPPPASSTTWNCDFSGSTDVWCYGDTDPITSGEESWLCSEGVTWACAGNIDQVDPRIDAWGCYTTSSTTYACFGDIDNRTTSDESWSCALGSDYWACSGNIDRSDAANESWTCQLGSNLEWTCLGDVDKEFLGSESFTCSLGGLPTGRAWECRGSQSWLAPVVSNPDFLLSSTLIGTSAFASHRLPIVDEPDIAQGPEPLEFADKLHRTLTDAHREALKHTTE